MPIDAETPGLSEEQRLLAESVGRFVRERCTPEQQRQWSSGKGAGDAWREIAALGWVGVAVTEESGGLGGSGIEEAIVASGIGHGPLPIAYAPIAVMAVELLKRSATGRAMLPRVVAGEVRFAVADDEPGIVFGGAPATEIAQEGSGYRVSGRKSLVLGLDEAESILVTARDAATLELVVVRVPSGSAGIDRRDMALLDGRTAADLRLDATVVLDDILLRGEEAEAALASARNRAAVASAAESVGVMRGALDLVQQHLAARRQFGQALADFQVLRHRFAEMAAALEMAESVVIAAAFAIDDPSRGARMASIAKAKAASAGLSICESAVQLHGGLGMSAEYGVGQYYKRLLVLNTLFGSRDEHLDRLSGAALPA